LYLISYICSFSLLAFMPFRVQRKRTSSVLCGERNDSRSLAVSLLARLRRTTLHCLQREDVSGSREVHTPLRGAPPKRFSSLYFTAWLREMALIKTFIYCFFNVPPTARSTSQGGVNFSYPPQVDVKDGCPFLAPSLRQAKEGGL
jgi:hypothetical protein